MLRGFVFDHQIPYQDKTRDQTSVCVALLQQTPRHYPIYLWITRCGPGFRRSSIFVCAFEPIIQSPFLITNLIDVKLWITIFWTTYAYMFSHLDWDVLFRCDICQYLLLHQLVVKNILVQQNGCYSVVRFRWYVEPMWNDSVTCSKWVHVERLGNSVTLVPVMCATTMMNTKGPHGGSVPGRRYIQRNSIPWHRLIIRDYFKGEQSKLSSEVSWPFNIVWHGTSENNL